MKPLKTALLAAAVMLGLAFAPGWGQEGTEKPAKPEPKAKKPAEKKGEAKKPGLAGMHALMAKVCGLSQEQTDKIIVTNNARNDALKEFNDANGEKMKTLQKELNDLNAKRRKIDDDGHAAIMAVLTDEQKAAWNQYQMVRVIQMKLARARLTEDQFEAIKAEYVRAAVGVDLSNEKDRNRLGQKLLIYVQKEILTDAQRLELSKPQEPGKVVKIKPDAKPVKNKPDAPKPKEEPAVEE